MSALALRKQWEQEGTKCERAAESGVRMICMCARARGIGNMKYRGNPRVFPEFPDFYITHTHKQCDCYGATWCLTDAPRDYINSNEPFCKQL